MGSDYVRDMRQRTGGKEGGKVSESKTPRKDAIVIRCARMTNSSEIANWTSEYGQLETELNEALDAIEADLKENGSITKQHWDILKKHGRIK
jgi:hypothetical protein